MTTLAIVPARGGSKGLPGKNLAEVGGLSLVARSVRLAGSVPRIDEVVVSSDADEILTEGERFGAGTHRRPADLASDTATIDDLVRLLLSERPSVTEIVVLQPTSPLRVSGDVEACLAALDDAPAAATASRLAHPVEWMFRKDGAGRMDPIVGWDAFGSSRQAFEPAYQLNGAVYAALADYLLAGNGFVGPETVIVEMPVERSIDIDSAFDLRLARLLSAGTESLGR